MSTLADYWQWWGSGVSYLYCRPTRSQWSCAMCNIRMSVKNILNLIETRGIHGESWILLLHVGEASNHFGSKGSCVFPGIWGRAKPKNGGCQTEFPKAKKCTFWENQWILRLVVKWVWFSWSPWCGSLNTKVKSYQKKLLANKGSEIFWGKRSQQTWFYQQHPCTFWWFGLPFSFSLPSQVPSPKRQRPGCW